MQIMVNRRLKEGTRTYDKIKSLKVAFVVDECHRAVCQINPDFPCLEAARIASIA